MMASLAMPSIVQLGQEVEKVDLVLGKAINALAQLVHSHGLLAVQLVKQKLVLGAQVELLAVVAAHGWVQLLGQGVCVGLQLPEKIGGNGDVVTSTWHKQDAQPLSWLQESLMLQKRAWKVARDSDAVPVSVIRRLPGCQRKLQYATCILKNTQMTRTAWDCGFCT